MKPREYQNETLSKICKYLKCELGNPLVSLPTGTGKSLVIAMLCKKLLKKKERKILVATHVKEIIDQNSIALQEYWPTAEWGIYSAGLQRRDMEQPIIFGSVQSIHKRIFEFEPFDILIVDECHLIPPKGEGRYQRMVKRLKLNRPSLRVIGFTATPYRLGSGLLTDGNIFDEIVYEATIQRMIDDGYLSPVKSRGSEIKIDLSDVGIRQGDYIIGDLEKALKVDNVTERALQECIERHSDRRSWLVFCVNVRHALEARDILRGHGLSCETITGKTARIERKTIIEKFKAGEIQAITNCMVLTTGFNAPRVDLLVMLRPTKSPVLYVQSVGRGTRLFEGKTDCLVKDFASLVETHGPIDTVRARRQSIIRSRGQVIVRGIPCRECPVCHEFVPIARKVCECGFEFPEPPPHSARATHEGILSKDNKQCLERIDYVRYLRGQRKGKKPYMRVEYLQKGRGLARTVIAREFICFEHGGYATKKAGIWWQKHGGGMPVPKKVKKALRRLEELREPSSISVNRAPKYAEVTGYVWE